MQINYVDLCWDNSHVWLTAVALDIMYTVATIIGRKRLSIILLCFLDQQRKLLFLEKSLWAMKNIILKYFTFFFLAKTTYVKKLCQLIRKVIQSSFDYIDYKWNF